MAGSIARSSNAPWGSQVSGDAAKDPPATGTNDAGAGLAGPGTLTLTMLYKVGKLSRRMT